MSNKLIELQIYYELAMSIGNTLDLRVMLKESLSAYLRKLNCPCGMVLQETERSPGVFRFEPLLSIPRSGKRRDSLARALATIPQAIDGDALTRFRSMLPICASDGLGSFHHIMDLPGFGLLILVKSKAVWSTPVLEALEGLNKKLARACLSCLQKQELTIEIEQRKRAQRALGEREEHLQMVWNSVQTGVVVIDSSTHTITDANALALEMIGLTRDKVIGRLCHEFICPREMGKCPITDLGEDGDKSERVLLNAEGESIPILKTVSKITLDGREHLIESFTDITERKQAEEELERHRDHLEELVSERTAELRQSNVELEREITERKEAQQALQESKDEAEAASRAKSQFLAKMSHEIRTPLNGIIGFSEIIRSSDTLAESKRHAHTILEESEHLLTLINGILDHAKIEAGRLELERCNLSLDQLLDSVVSSSHIQARSRGIELRSHVAEGVFQHVLGDPLRLRQILLNLVSNAIRFTENGHVEVKIERLECESNVQVVRFSVTDTGIGIAPERQASIFESFVQAEEGTTRKYGGTGLGITIAKQLVSVMGGQIGLDSELGKGSTFWFIVPLEIAEEQLDPVNADRARHGIRTHEGGSERRPGRILVAEDYPVNQQLVRQHLENAGHSVTIVEDGEAAIRACASNRYDLVLMDVQMPKMDGFEATRRIRSSCEGPAVVPILALTANADAETRAACQDAGMNDVLTKPIRRRTLLEALDRWLDKSDSAPSERGEQQEDAGVEVADPHVIPIDLQVALEEFGNEEVVDEVVSEFLRRVARQIEEMRNDVGAPDIDPLRRNAHAIKGGAATLEAKPLAEAAAELERLCKLNDRTAVPTALQSMEAEFDRLRKYVGLNQMAESKGS